MQPDHRVEQERNDAFGREFGSLMARLTGSFDSLVDAVEDPVERERLRRRVATEFENEAEALMARHLVTGRVADYVRHVVREGFESDFDPMDPCEAAREARAHPCGPTGWTTSAPSEPGAYALRHPSVHVAVELARFDRTDRGWLVHRWGQREGVSWSDLEHLGWRRWGVAARTPTP